MDGAGEEIAENEVTFKAWCQGDATLDVDLEFSHLADLKHPATQQAEEVVKEIEATGEEWPNDLVLVSSEVQGFVVLSQTCDIVRDADRRPYVEIAPLIKVDARDLEQTRKLKFPNRAYVPGVANLSLVADLDRTMTIEKPIMRRWRRIQGCSSDSEVRLFQEALKRKRGRFAFPDDFELAVQKLQKRMIDRANKDSSEGSYVDAVTEIRVRADPSWGSDKIKLEFWFIKDQDPLARKDGEQPGQEWPKMVRHWIDLVALGGRFVEANGFVTDYKYMTAGDYLDSDRLDLDRLSMDE